MLINRLFVALCRVKIDRQQQKTGDNRPHQTARKHAHQLTAFPKAEIAAQSVYPNRQNHQRRQHCLSLGKGSSCVHPSFQKQKAKRQKHPDINSRTAGAKWHCSLPPEKATLCHPVTDSRAHSCQKHSLSKGFVHDVGERTCRCAEHTADKGKHQHHNADRHHGFPEVAVILRGAFAQRNPQSRPDRQPQQSAR